MIETPIKWGLMFFKDNKDSIPTIREKNQYQP